MTYLLDINVLITLFDTQHVHHVAAHRWFSSVGNSSWATCPITENGFVRVVSNPAYPTALASPDDAATRLRVFCSASGYVFWPDIVSLLDATTVDASQIRGHQQITDAYLAALAFHHGGRLATFDSRIPASAIVGAAPDVIELIPTA